MQNTGYITRHSKYINYRIGVILNYITDTNSGPSSKKNHKIAPCDIIFNLISENAISINVCDEFKSALNELKALTRRWDILNDGDLIGYIYQQIKSTGQKKKQGQYFTPRDVVEYLIDKSILPDTDINNIKILDPACGSGQFLTAAYKHLLKIYMSNDVPVEEAAFRIISNNLYGYDLDQIALMIAKYNLSRISGIDAQKINVYNNNFLFNKNPVDNKGAIHINRFNFILGNPPWGSSLTSEEKRIIRSTYQAGETGINTFTLFMEKALSLLTENGRIAFLIPEAYLNIKAHRASRSQILGRTRILDIALWGEKFKGVYAPSISIVAELEASDNARSKNILHIHAPAQHRQQTVTLIPQAYYLNTPDQIFNIHYTRKAVNLISKIQDQDCFYLADNAKFFLGIVTGNNPQLLRSHASKEFPDPIVIGKDISQYRIDFSGHHFKYDPDNLQQIAPRDLYLTKNKLLYKFIDKKLVFALDRKGYYSLNNVNALIPQVDNIAPECLLSLLNSRVIQYYYEKNFFTLKVLRGNLERLPLKKLSKSSQKRIGSLSAMVIESSSGKSAVECREEIEDIIFYEYGIKDKEAFMISGQQIQETYQ